MKKFDLIAFPCLVCVSICLDQQNSIFFSLQIHKISLFKKTNSNLCSDLKFQFQYLNWLMDTNQHMYLFRLKIWCTCIATLKTNMNMLIHTENIDSTKTGGQQFDNDTHYDAFIYTWPLHSKKKNIFNVFRFVHYTFFTIYSPLRLHHAFRASTLFQFCTHIWNNYQGMYDVYWRDDVVLVHSPFLFFMHLFSASQFRMKNKIGGVVFTFRAIQCLCRKQLKAKRNEMMQLRKRQYNKLPGIKRLKKKKRRYRIVWWQC